MVRRISNGVDLHLFERSHHEIRETLRRLESILCSLTEKVTAMSAAQDASFLAMKNQVERSTSVVTSIKVLIDNLAQQIVANKTDPVAMQALADQLTADNDTLQGLVTANTGPASPSATASNDAALKAAGQAAADARAQAQQAAAVQAQKDADARAATQAQKPFGGPDSPGRIA
jgi:hypothetical protein